MILFSTSIELTTQEIVLKKNTVLLYVLQRRIKPKHTPTLRNEAPHYVHVC